MGKIAYRKIAGVASDVRFVEGNHTLGPDEFFAPEGDVLPNAASLSDPEPLTSVKARLKAEIDRAAEAERQKYITRGSGQALVYEAKNQEATKWATAGQPSSPAASDYPFAAARAQRLNVTIAAVLTEWSQIISGWRAIAIAIENAREGAKEDIDAAPDAAAVLAARNAVVWPSL